MGSGGHRVFIASYGRYKEGVKSVLGSALLCGLVCPLLPFLGSLVSPALTYSSQPPPKPALQSDEHSRVSGPRWTLWSQVRCTIPLFPGSPVSVCSYAYLQFPVSKSALASAVPVLISELCLRQADLTEHSTWLVLVSMSCPRLFLYSLQLPFSLTFMTSI